MRSVLIRDASALVLTDGAGEAVDGSAEAARGTGVERKRERGGTLQDLAGREPARQVQMPSLAHGDRDEEAVASLLKILLGLAKERVRLLEASGAAFDGRQVRDRDAAVANVADLSVQVERLDVERTRAVEVVALGAAVGKRAQRLALELAIADLTVDRKRLGEGRFRALEAPPRK